MTVSVLTYTSLKGEARKGVCSNYLARTLPGTKVQFFVRNSDFKLPEDLSKPIIMIGPGTGIAPLRSFWQEREFLVEKEKKTLGPCYLFFGCRGPSDHLYKGEVEKLSPSVITNYFVAYSRVSEKKQYVQDLMKENAQLIWELIYEKNASIYICGDVKMAKEVSVAILDIAETSGYSRHEAQELISVMKKNKRYKEDLFGITLHTQRTLTSERAVWNKPSLSLNSKASQRSLSVSSVLNRSALLGVSEVKKNNNNEKKKQLF